MMQRSIAKALLLLCVNLTPVLADKTNREWTSTDGRTLTAQVLKIDAQKETIQLKRDDGVQFTIEWSRLSESDVVWITERLESQKETAPTASNSIDADTSSQELPDKFTLKDVPMVKQKGNFCVPASATMIAGFHGLKTDQDEVADLSSEASASNQGTYPSDMLLAMEKLGFDGQQQYWKTEGDFHKTALPAIRRALVDTGPIYISFKSGVFGTMGHGCVIIGYNDRREEMTFHNPWGNVFIKSYEEVSIEGHGVVYIDPPKPAPVADDSFIEKMKAQIPEFDGDFMVLATKLAKIQLAHELVWCSRRDARDDKKFAQDTARSDGRKILELAFERNPAVLIPYSPSGTTEAYYLVTRPPNGGSSFQVYEISPDGWSEPELKNLGRLTRNWSTQFVGDNAFTPVWELPMIELHSIE